MAAVAKFFEMSSTGTIGPAEVGAGRHPGPRDRTDPAADADVRIRDGFNIRLFQHFWIVSAILRIRPAPQPSWPRGSPRGRDRCSYAVTLASIFVPLISNLTQQRLSLLVAMVNLGTHPGLQSLSSLGPLEFTKT